MSCAQYFHPRLERCFGADSRPNTQPLANQLNHHSWGVVLRNAACSLELYGAVHTPNRDHTGILCLCSSSALTTPQDPLLFKSARLKSPFNLLTASMWMFICIIHSLGMQPDHCPAGGSQRGTHQRGGGVPTWEKAVP